MNVVKKPFNMNAVK